MNGFDTERYLRAMRDECHSLDPLDIWLWTSLYAVSNPKPAMLNVARMAREHYLATGEP